MKKLLGTLLLITAHISSMHAMIDSTREMTDKQRALHYAKILQSAADSLNNESGSDIMQRADQAIASATHGSVSFNTYLNQAIAKNLDCDPTLIHIQHLIIALNSYNISGITPDIPTIFDLVNERSANSWLTALQDLVSSLTAINLNKEKIIADIGQALASFNDIDLHDVAFPSALDMALSYCIHSLQHFEGNVEPSDNEIDESDNNELDSQHSSDFERAMTDVERITEEIDQNEILNERLQNSTNGNNSDDELNDRHIATRTNSLENYLYRSTLMHRLNLHENVSSRSIPGLLWDRSS